MAPKSCAARRFVESSPSVPKMRATSQMMSGHDLFVEGQWIRVGPPSKTDLGLGKSTLSFEDLLALRSLKRSMTAGEQQLHVPTIDVGALLAAKDEFDVEATLQDPNGAFRGTIDALRSAAAEWGFFYITNHGVTPEQIAGIRQASREFFALPKEIKNKTRRRSDNSRGYFDEELTKNKIDWKEVFEIAAPHEDLHVSENGYARILENNQNQWLSEDELPGFRATVQEYFERLEQVARRILQLFAVALGEPANTFDKHFNGSASSSNDAASTKERFYKNSSRLRFNYYPIAAEPEKTMGLYHHTDSGAVTILLQDDDVASLQVFHRGLQQWHDVAPIPNSFVVNIGDLVQVWSNDKFLAPPHRVLASGSQERYSIPFFHNPSLDTDVVPFIVRENEKPRYRPLNWRAFRRHKVIGNVAQIGEDLQISRYRIHDPEDPYQLAPIPN